MIAAHDPNLVIGMGGKLPWHIPEDLAHFKKRTRGHAVIMGRGVFEELKCKPLPDRRNVVLTRNRSYDNVEVCRSPEEALALLSDKEKVYIIGGAEVYKLFYRICNRLEMTQIHKSYQGDTFFPEYRHEIGKVWKEVARQEHDDLTFVDYTRIP
jgi:dihydrofolate reductase